MDRQQWIDLIDDLIARGVIGADQRAALLDAYDAGILPERLPLPPYFDAAEDEADEDDRTPWILAWFAVSIAAGAGLATAQRRLPAARRTQARDALRRTFEREIERHAAAVTQSGNVRAWQRNMQDSIATYTRGMATAGAGRPLDPVSQAIIRRTIDEQRPYLARFAGEIAVRQAPGSPQPMTHAHIAARSRMYGGSGWSAWHMGNEIDQPAGIVVQYIARDDWRTCDPCLRYHLRYFLPGEGPYPGQICEGRGLCRCERVTVYRPDIYADLIGDPLRDTAGGPFTTAPAWRP